MAVARRFSFSFFFTRIRITLYTYRTITTTRKWCYMYFTTDVCDGQNLEKVLSKQTSCFREKEIYIEIKRNRSGSVTFTSAGIVCCGQSVQLVQFAPLRRFYLINMYRKHKTPPCWQSIVANERDTLYKCGISRLGQHLGQRTAAEREKENHGRLYNRTVEYNRVSR